MDLIEDVTDFEKTVALFAHLAGKIHEIDDKLTNNELDVDEFTTQSQAPLTIWRPIKNYYLPIVVEFVVAVFPVATTSASITLGPRVIPITNLAAGIFSFDCRMQLEKDDDRFLTIAPAGAAFLEIMGRATKQQVDRP